jgi:hypothetical protein
MNPAEFKVADGGDGKIHDDLNDGTRFMFGAEYYF